VVEVPVFVKKEIVVEHVKVVEKVKEVTVDKPKFEEQIIFMPKYVTKVISVEQVKIIPIEKEVVVEKLVEKEVVVEKEVIVDRPKFRERVVDVIKPHYVCQNCGKEV
jgi:hypothetical protein